MHQMTFVLRSTLASAVLALLGAPAALAAGLPPQLPQIPGLPRPGIAPPDESQLPDELTKYSNLRSGVMKIVNYALGFLGLIAIIVVIYAGFMYLTDGGQGKNTATAKKMLLYAILGILLILLSYTIVNFVIGIPSNSQTAAGGGGIGYP